MGADPGINGPFFEAFSGKCACRVVEVMLLSGNCCSQIFNLDQETLEDVLRQCADLLGLNKDKVLGSATLMHETSVITDLKEDFMAGKMYELTLILS